MANNSAALRVGVVGTGAFGRNHARVYRELADDPANAVEFVGVADADAKRSQAVAAEFGTRAFRTLDELVAAGVQAVSVAVPTASHLEVARKLMQSEVDVLIEKPLATNRRRGRRTDRDRRSAMAASRRPDISSASIRRCAPPCRC